MYYKQVTDMDMAVTTLIAKPDLNGVYYNQTINEPEFTISHLPHVVKNIECEGDFELFCNGIKCKRIPSEILLFYSPTTIFTIKATKPVQMKYVLLSRQRREQIYNNKNFIYNYLLYKDNTITPGYHTCLHCDS